MADNFNGVTLITLLGSSPTRSSGGGMWVPQWKQSLNYSERHIPYANHDLLQFAGRSNYTLTIPVRVDNNNDVATFQGLQDGLAHALVYNGMTYATVYLVDVSEPDQLGVGTGQAEWNVKLTFKRTGG